MNKQYLTEQTSKNNQLFSLGPSKIASENQPAQQTIWK